MFPNPSSPARCEGLDTRGGGTTVVILHPEGSAAILGKCRCEASSVLKWFQEPHHRRPEAFEDLWPGFIVPRMRGCLDRCRDVESTYSDCGYRFALPGRPLPADPARLCAELVQEAERGIRREGDVDGFLDRCGNHQILVDLRARGSVALFQLEGVTP